MISDDVDGGLSEAESSAGSSQKAKAEGPLIRHLHRTRQISLPSQPLPLEPPCKLSPPPPSEPRNPHKRDRTLEDPPDDRPPQPAAIFIANNVDLLEQIFLYLPPKSLIRFQSVSKKWLSVISDPAFRSLHSRIAASSSATATPDALFLFGWNFNKFQQELNFISLSYGNGVLWNGDFYWACNQKYIICFDWEKECLRPEMLSLPVELGEREIWYFGECNGCLHLIEVNSPSTMVFDVFEMARDYLKWIPKYHIDLAALRSLYPSIVDESFDPLDERRCRFGMPFFLDNEKEKKASIVISFQGKLIMYNINDTVVTELAEVGPMDFGYWRGQFYQWKDTYRYMEMLVCV